MKPKISLRLTVKSLPEARFGLRVGISSDISSIVFWHFFPHFFRHGISSDTMGCGPRYRCKTAPWPIWSHRVMVNSSREGPEVSKVDGKSSILWSPNGINLIHPGYISTQDLSDAQGAKIGASTNRLYGVPKVSQGPSDLSANRYHKGVLGRKDVLQGGKYAKSISNKSKNDKSKSGKVSFWISKSRKAEKRKGVFVNFEKSKTTVRTGYF